MLTKEAESYLITTAESATLPTGLEKDGYDCHFYNPDEYFPEYPPGTETLALGPAFHFGAGVYGFFIYDQARMERVEHIPWEMSFEEKKALIDDDCTIVYGATAAVGYKPKSPNTS